MTAPVAIVAWDGTFAGGPTPDAFWSHLIEGRDAASPLFDRSSPWTPNVHRTPMPDAVRCERACRLDPLPSLPAWLADTHPGLRALDPVFTLAITTAVNAWRAAQLESIDPSRVGVALGNIMLPTAQTSALSAALRLPAIMDALRQEYGVDWVGPHPTGSASARWSTGSVAGTVARVLGLGGPHLTLDAACASTYYALDLGVRALQSGQVDAMLVGGVNRPDSLYTQMGFSQLQALSTSGRCRPFDAGADGLIVGEGAGMFVLQRLADAHAQRRPILATIRGIGLTNDTHGNLLAPAMDGQVGAMDLAYREAQWHPAMVDLMECHATGTPVGDAVELRSLAALWRRFDDTRTAPIWLGAVKGNVGHLLPGAGAAALAKVLLAFEHRAIPPVANFETPSTAIDWSALPFAIPTQTEAWSRDQPRRAALSGFGFGGTNAHVLLEDGHEMAKEGVRISVPERPSKKSPEPIAIVRWAGRWGHHTGDELTTALIRDIPRDGVAIDHVALPHGVFRFPPSELTAALPQQLLLLHLAHQAAHDWAVADHHRAGVFVGTNLDFGTTEYQLRWRLCAQGPAWANQLNVPPDEQARWIAALLDAVTPPLDADRTVGGLASIAASRVARMLGWGGPAYVCSSEETSALTALRLATEALQREALDVALVGGVEFSSDPRTEASLRAHGLSKPADGGVAVVLKRLSDARRDGDPVWAVIDQHIDHTVGRVGEIMASTSERHEVLSRLIEDTTVRVPLFTPKRSLRDTVAWQRVVDTCPGLGPHVEGPTLASGGLVAVLHAVVHLAHRRTPTGDPWLADDDEPELQCIVAGTSASGAVQAVRLRAGDAIAPPDALRTEERLEALFVVPEASSDDDRSRQQLATLAREDPTSTIDTLARRWYAAIDRNALGDRVSAFVATTPAHLLRLIEQPDAAAGSESTVFAAPEHRLAAEGDVVVVFPGSGTQYAGMGRALALAFPEHLEAQRTPHGRLRSIIRPTLAWHTPTAQQGTDPTGLIIAHVALTGFAHAVLESLGVRAQAMLGHSLGESCSLFASGAWTDRDVLLDRVAASPLFSTELAGPCHAARRYWQLPANVPVQWSLAVVRHPSTRVTEAIDEAGAGRVFLLIINSPEACVIGGQAGDVDAVVRTLGGLTYRLGGITTVHCPVAQLVESDYEQLHRLPTRDPGIRIYSGAWTRSYTPTTESAARSITDQALTTLDFASTIEQAYADGGRVFVEVGPGATCTRMVEATLGGRPHVAVSMSSPSRDGMPGLLRTLATLVVHGVPVDLSALYGTPVNTHPGPHLRVNVGPRPLGALPSVPTTPPSRSSNGVSSNGVSSNGVSSSDVSFTVAASREPTVAEAPQARPRSINGGGSAFAREPNDSTSSSTQPSSSTRPSTSARPSSSTRPSTSTPIESSQQLALALAQQSSRTAQAHTTYLALARSRLRLLERLSVELNDGGFALPTTPPVLEPPTPPISSNTSSLDTPAVTASARKPSAPVSSNTSSLTLNRLQCLEFAKGSIAEVLGPEFAAADRFPTRVRLPDEPLMLVDRVLELEGEPRSMTHGRIVTEHDVHADRWYLDGGCIPTAIAVESGQADLMLSAWLGIDLQTKGLAMYRLLDAVVEFYQGLPTVGQTIRYDIRIERFFRQGDIWLFRFAFDATVEGQPLMSMRDGCAGFFTAQQLDDGQGIITVPAQRARPGQRDPDVVLLPGSPLALHHDAIEALRRGDLVGAFGPVMAHVQLEHPLTLPGGALRLLDRITTLEPNGGPWGHGRVVGEFDVEPDAWFLTCHFIDDQVMPGTLMYECCLHTLRVLLMRWGWLGEDGQVAFEPVPGIRSRLKCRGQVLSSTPLVRYEILVRESGYGTGGTPYVIADAIMYEGDRPIVEITDMSARLRGTDRERLKALHATPQAFAEKPAIYDRDRILAFAEGNPSDAFGPPYLVFDQQRQIARLPRPPFAFIDRVTATQGEPFVMQAGASCEAQVDLRPDDWFFTAAQNGGAAQPIPFAVLLEMVLQPCGWLAAFVGSALTSATDLRFRNLGGQASLHQKIMPRHDCLTTRVSLDRVSHSGGMIIQHYSMAMHDRLGQAVYDGTTYFGFFSAAALADQVGLRDVTPRPRIDAAAAVESLPRTAPFPGEQLRMIDRIDALEFQGGEHDLGYATGSIAVDPDAWFFSAHFYQDPVWPGSLGLQAFLQLLQHWASRRWPMTEETVISTITSTPPHRWEYRGQVVPTAQRVQVDATITQVDDARQTVWADGVLSVDDRPIYAMNTFGIEVVR